MSLEAMVWALYQDVEPGAKIVLIGLANHANHDHECYPSVPRLAHYSRTSRDTVMRKLRRLEKMGLCRVERRPGKASWYTLAVTEIDPNGWREIDLDATSSKLQPVANGTDTSGKSDVTSRTAMQPHQSHSYATRTNKNQSKEPINGTDSSEVPAAPAEPPAKVEPEAHVEDPNHPNPRRPKLGEVADTSPVICLVPLNGSGGRPFALTEALAESMKKAYPAVDIPRAFHAIRQWNLVNPANRKTPNGIGKHVRNWLEREQNKAARVGGSGPTGTTGLHDAVQALQEGT